ncbi:amidase [Actinomadura sp. 3N407]|uniref:amidase n=1 Tax=Actinomadura sp. 3N407 TaxID=3457423 RepID=UPI003FCE1C7F
MPNIGYRTTAAGTAMALAVSGIWTSPPPAAAQGGGADLETMTIPEIQRSMDSGRLSSERLTRHYLRGIRKVDGHLHAVLNANPDALRHARESDRRRAGGRLRGPMDGIPVLLKGNIGTGDKQPTTAGSTAMTRARPADAFLVKKLRTMGAVLLGKANLSQWAAMRSSKAVSGWSSVGGLTANPYALDRSPCGSSSGSAVAVSARLATVALGTETDGSITCPSSMNGVVGLKPTRGAISRRGLVPISLKQDTPGPIGRNTTDTALLLALLQGPDPGDPATLQGPGPGDQVTVSGGGFTIDPGDPRKRSLRGARIGVWRSAVAGGPDGPEILDRSVAALGALGATLVEPVDLPPVDRLSEFKALLCEFKHDLNHYLAATPGDHPRTLAGLIAYNRAHSGIEMPYFGQDYFEAAEQTSGDLDDPACAGPRAAALRSAREALQTTLERHRLDAIVSLTTGPAWKADLATGDPAFESAASPAAIAGHPHLTVPAGQSAGLPVGLSLIGPRWSDARLLAFGFAFEQFTKARRPPPTAWRTP